jgi:hypothetical protein
MLHDMTAAGDWSDLHMPQRVPLRCRNQASTYKAALAQWAWLDNHSAGLAAGA